MAPPVRGRSRRAVCTRLQAPSVRTRSPQQRASTTANATVYVTNYAGTFTFHNDNLRTGQNLSETVLTPSNVKSATFGKLFSYPLDGLTFASPLYVANVNIPGKGFHNVVYVATEHDSVYAFDADGLSGTPIWHDSFIDPANGITPVPAADTGETGDIPNEIGITEHARRSIPPPAPCTSRRRRRVVSGGTTTYRHSLHALDITTGAEKFGGPVTIQASVPGSGTGFTRRDALVPPAPGKPANRPLALERRRLPRILESRRQRAVPRLGARLQRDNPPAGHDVLLHAERRRRRHLDERRRRGAPTPPETCTSSPETASSTPPAAAATTATPSSS